MPMYKDGNREEPLNYRPVSLISGVCKLFENIMTYIKMNEMEENQVISASQFVSVKNHHALQT